MVRPSHLSLLLLLGAATPLFAQNSFIPVASCRVADTRPTSPVLAATPQAFTIAGGSSACSMSIPTSATAYLLNVTAIPISGMLSYLTIWPTGTAQPSVFTLSSPEGQIIANSAIVAAGTSNQVSIFVTNTSNIVLDISGYFVAGGGTSGVSSFNSRTGAVMLMASDVNGLGAITNSTSGNAATATSATQLNGGAIPASQACVGTNGSSQIVAGTCSGGSLPTTNQMLSGNGSGGAVGTLVVNTAEAVTGGGGNGIVNALTTAGTTQTTVFSPPTYTSPVYPATGEKPPCYYNNIGYLYNTDGCAHSMLGNILYTDQRFGQYSLMVDGCGLLSCTSGNNYFAQNRIDSFWTLTLPAVAGEGTALNVNNISLFGGSNYNLGGPLYSQYGNQSFYQALDVWTHAYTPGQHIGVRSQVQKYSVGDTVLFYGIGGCFGGYQASPDEGCEGHDIQVHQGTIEYRGPVSGTSSSTITTTAAVGAAAHDATSSGQGTQGAGRFLVDVDSSVSYTTGTISVIGTSGPITFTGTGSWPVSTVNTTSSTAITTPGTGINFTVAVATGISIGTRLCYADPYEIEQVIVTNVSGTTITANFRYPHPASSIVAAGGLACQFIALDADTALASTFNSSLTVQLATDMHYLLPIIVSTSGTSLEVWIPSPSGTPPLGAWNGYRGRWQNITGFNTYSIYPGAMVTSVMQNQALSGEMTIEVPVASLISSNGSMTAPFTTGHNTMQPLYPGTKVTVGIDGAQKIFPDTGGGSPAADWKILAGLWYGDGFGNDIVHEIDNNTPTSIYNSQTNGHTGSTGNKTGPWLFKTTGVFDSYFYTQLNPNNLIKSDDSVLNWQLVYQYTNTTTNPISNPSPTSPSLMGFGVDPTNNRFTFTGPGYGTTVTAGVYPQTGLFFETLTTPTSSSMACLMGQFTDDVNYHYVCVATNTWKRVALTAF